MRWYRRLPKVSRCSLCRHLFIRGDSLARWREPICRRCLLAYVKGIRHAIRLMESELTALKCVQVKGEMLTSLAWSAKEFMTRWLGIYKAVVAIIESDYGIRRNFGEEENREDSREVGGWA